MIGNSERALVVENGTLMLVENPARIETVRRMVWLGGCLLAAVAGIGAASLAVRLWTELLRGHGAHPWSLAMGVSIAAVVFIVSAPVGTIIVLRRKPVAPTRKVLAVLDPQTGLMRWEATGHAFALDRVVLRIRVVPEEDHEYKAWPRRPAFAIPSLLIGPHTTMFPTFFAFVPTQGPVRPADFDQLTPRFDAWGIRVHVENPTIF